MSVAYAATGLFTPSAAPPPPPAVTLEGIDVSHYQGAIDWPSVAAAGKRFAIVQATDGETCLDPMYATNHANARAAGTRVTAYHFAEPSSTPGEAIVQADWFVNSAALLPGDLVPALDLEQTGGLSVSDLQAWVGAWLGEVTAKLGVRPMIYASPSFWTSSMGDTTMFADQGYSVLWIAHWGTSSPTLPAANWGGHGWTFWQYTSTGSVAGHLRERGPRPVQRQRPVPCLVQLHVRAAAARRAAQRPTRARRRDAEQRSGRRLRPGHHDPGGELRVRRLHGLLERDAAAHVVRLADAAGGGRAGRPDRSARRRLRHGRQPGDGRGERPRSIQRHG